MSSFMKIPVFIRDVNRKPAAVATRVGGLYHITINQAHATVATTTPIKEDIWHCRYSHLSLKYFQILARKQLVNNFDFSATQKIQFCESCFQGKQHKVKFPLRSDMEKQRNH